MNSTSDASVSIQMGHDGYGEQDAVFNQVWRAIGDLRLAEDFVRPGDHVVLKPNWVRECDERFDGPDRWEHMVTHPLVIEAVAKWVAERLCENGIVTICDGPQTDSSFAKIRSYCRLDAMIARLDEAYPNVRFELLDLRPEEWQKVEGVVVNRRPLRGDPMGLVDIALNEDSFFVGFDGLGRLFGASFDVEETNARHAGTNHEYRICRTPMSADVVINIPKLKTHKKVGLTCALKNLVGINGDRNWLPHHTEGTFAQGGDQFPKNDIRSRTETRWMGFAKRVVYRFPPLAWLLIPSKKAFRLVFGDTKKIVRSGNWHGNDTCWRMVLDLNLCFFGFDSRGQERSTPLRYLSVVDGIIGGEGDGPMSPDPVRCGVILAGTHPVAVDTVAAVLMGFDPGRIPLLREALGRETKYLPAVNLDQIQIKSNVESWTGGIGSFDSGLRFRPHFGWINAIERSTKSDSAEPRTCER
jgi:uncharacterized protein (DUF362 family)